MITIAMVWIKSQIKGIEALANGFIAVVNGMILAYNAVAGVLGLGKRGKNDRERDALLREKAWLERKGLKGDSVWFSSSWSPFPILSRISYIIGLILAAIMQEPIREEKLDDLLNVIERTLNHAETCTDPKCHVKSVLQRKTEGKNRVRAQTQPCPQPEWP